MPHVSDMWNASRSMLARPARGSNKRDAPGQLDVTYEAAWMSAPRYRPISHAKYDKQAVAARNGAAGQSHGRARGDQGGGREDRPAAAQGQDAH
jgi:hypothetical protein